MLALYGRAGYFAGVLRRCRAADWPGIYGLSGILVAHVFFNLPLATRLFLEALDTVPADQWRLASQLGMGAGAAFRLIEWPALRAALPGVAGLVFMLCITSFTIVLTLGGGPARDDAGGRHLPGAALRFRSRAGGGADVAADRAHLRRRCWLLTRLGANAAGDANLPVAPRRFVSRRHDRDRAQRRGDRCSPLLFVAGPMRGHR